MTTFRERPADTAPQRCERAEPAQFGPDSMMWELTGDTRTLTTIGAPLIMQAMHPAIGAAVERYSVYRTDPWGRAIRSFDSIMLWIYGGTAAAEEGRRLRKLHAPIQGVDDHGNAYHALNPGPYAWVHGTVFAWMVASHPLLHGRELTDAEQERLYGEVLHLGRILGVPDRAMPPDRDSYWRYYERMLRDELEAHPAALNVLSDMQDPLPPPALPKPLRPLWPLISRPAGRMLRRTTVAAMPPAVRERLRITWTAADERKARRVFRLVRALHPLLPERLRFLPVAVHARRHARAVGAVRRRATVSVA